MKKFTVKESFWEVFPEAKIGTIVFEGIDNRVKETEKYQKMIEEAERQALTYFGDEDFSSNKVIKVWREAFSKFKTKKGARSSIEALLKRAYKKKPIGTINPLVDLYNSISLKYALPCGGEDMDTFAGDIRLTKAEGNEAFVTLGSDKSEPPYEGEIIYKDDAGGICRCWNWREAVRTMLTEDTRNAFLCIELVDNTREEAFHEALTELKDLVEKHLGGTGKISVLDRDHREIVIQE